jgi:hypothetical protein
MGIGFAAIRDIVSFLRYATKDNPLALRDRPRIRRALGFGISQSGRVLRDLVHLGFNQDLVNPEISAPFFLVRRVRSRLASLHRWCRLSGVSRMLSVKVAALALHGLTAVVVWSDNAALTGA